MSMKGKKRILIAEDDVFIAKAYSLKLDGEGYAVEIADDGLAAWRAMEADKPDLIILDMMMPEMDGFEFLKKLSKSKFKGTPVIVMTNLGQKNDQEEVMRLGAKEYLIKANINFSDVLDVIERHIK